MSSNDWSPQRQRQDSWIKPFIAGAVMSYATFNLIAYKRKREYRKGIRRKANEKDFSIFDHYTQSYQMPSSAPSTLTTATTTTNETVETNTKPLRPFFRNPSPTGNIKVLPTILKNPATNTTTATTAIKPRPASRDKSEGSANTLATGIITTTSQATNVYDNRTATHTVEDLVRHIKNAERDMVDRVADLVIVIEKSASQSSSSIASPSPFYIGGGGDDYYDDNYVTTLVHTLEALGIRKLWFIEPQVDTARPSTTGSVITLDSSLNSYYSRRTSLMRRQQRGELYSATDDGSVVSSKKKKVVIVVDKELMDKTESEIRSKKCFVRPPSTNGANTTTTTSPTTRSIRSISPIRSNDTPIEDELEQREFKSTKQCIDTLVLEGYTLWCTGTDMTHPDSISLTQEDLAVKNEFENVQSNEMIPKKLAIVFGTKQGIDNGVRGGVGCFCSEPMRNASAKRIYQPLLRGMTDSSTLNLSVVTTLVVHQLFTIYPTIVGSSLPAKEKVKLRQRWYAKLSSQQQQSSLTVPRTISSPLKDSRRLTTLMKLREERQNSKAQKDDDDSSLGECTVAESTLSSSDMSEGNEKLPELRTKVLDLEDDLELKIQGLRNSIMSR